MATRSFGLAEPRPAVLTIDLHRGHLDPEVATVPLRPDPSARVVKANIEFLDAAREAGLPVVHVITTYRDLAEIHSNPFWKAIDSTASTRGNMRRHNFDGSPGTELMPGVLAPGDLVVSRKKRYDCFLGTDLEFVLRQLDVNILLVGGVNTNSCVLATSITASTRDYAVVVASDCVDTMDGSAFHSMALECVERAFGWVMPWQDALNAVSG